MNCVQCDKNWLTRENIHSLLDSQDGSKFSCGTEKVTLAHPLEQL
jgi:hypothetical protein